MTPLLLGHRGHRLGRFRTRPREAPIPATAADEAENTLPAFRRALAAGCSGLELDLRVSRDGVVVVHHDPFLGRGEAIAALRWRELHRINPQLATLDQILRRFHRTAWLDLEIKTDGVEVAMLQALHRRWPERGLVISSFSLPILRRLAQMEPTLPLCWNVRRPVSLRRLRAAGVAWVAPHQALCTAWYVRRLRAAGWHVLVWTVNRPSQMRMLVRAGADAIVSDHPYRLVEAAKRGQGPIPGTVAEGP